MLLIDLALFGVVGMSVWAVQMAWTPVMAAGIINGGAHYWGYRNFEAPDASTNISPLGILIAGEELHNNHHTYPTSAKLSVKPGLVYVTDNTMDHLAVKEAQRLGVPVIGVCDSNANPVGIDFPIPANDDALKAVQILLEYVVQAINEGKANLKQEDQA